MMRIILAVSVSFLMAEVVEAQEVTTLVGGVDQRVPALESQYLAQQQAATAQQFARAAAMLQVERENAAKAKEQADKVNAYWKAYVAGLSGCATGNVTTGK